MSVICLCLFVTTIPIFSIRASECQANVTNRFIISSFHENLPVIVKNLVVDTFDSDYNPSCANNEPNIILPGYVLLSEGKAYVPQKYNLTNNTVLKLTATSKSGAKYCLNGKSVRWFLPERYCRIELCEVIGDDMCALLEQPGTHTINELVKKINFNPKLKLPEPPCFLGLVCLTDFIGGKYHVEFKLDYMNETIMHWKIPTDREYLQVAEDELEGDDDDQ